MKATSKIWLGRFAKGMAAIALLAAVATANWWWPNAMHAIDQLVRAQRADAHSQAGHNHADHEQGAGDSHDHAGHDHAGHDHAGHDHNSDNPFERFRSQQAREHSGGEASGQAARQSLELTAQALKNLGLTPEVLTPVEFGDYQRTISIPAIVAPRPGRTQIRVSSPLSGVIMHVHAVTGQAVMPDEYLFKVRLTYEDLVETQTLFLKSLSELEVEDREIARLEEAVQTGAVPGKSLIERRYSKNKLEAYLTSLRESLKLHGLSEEQVNGIERDRKLLRDLTIVAPHVDEHEHEHEENLRLSRLQLLPASFRKSEPPASASAPLQPLIIDDLKVEKGQGVMAGELLCTLSDYSELYIEGRAFEQDAPAVARAAEQGWAIDALVPTTDGQETVPRLKLAYVANSVDPTSRTLSFYVELKNHILRDENRSEGQRFISWKYRVGQRMQLLVPVEIWRQQIVLPIDAAVKDGADWFVFRQKGNRFERISVHVKHRDQANLVIENDGAIAPGDIIARRAAHQLQMAIKNQSGAGVDPHAGHTH